MNFTDIDIHGDLQKGLAEIGYITCTPVQEQVITNAGSGRDLYVQSQTGTGKTAAFLVVIFQRLLSDASLKGKKALIMAPTRELAVQIEEEAKAVGRYLPFQIGAFYGGVGYGNQQKLLRNNCDILVGTPGRVLDLNSGGEMNLMDIAFLVIDEADRMFDMGFYPDLRKLITLVPPADRRQTMLFSATLNAYVKNLAWEYTREPLEIEIEAEHVTVDEITQLLYHVHSGDKLRLLLGIFAREKPESAIIFCNTKRYTEILAQRLRKNGMQCEFISGDLPQRDRLRIINDVKSGKLKYLVATDVAARGLDIDDLALVVNYDIPIEAENYIHRIGRTARAGKSGRAVTLASEQDVYELSDIEKYLSAKIPSQVATEEDYAEDVSAGMGGRGDFGSRSYDERRGSSRRDRERPSRPLERSRGSSSGQQNRDRPQPREAFQPKRTDAKNTESPENLGKMSYEDRMKYYKEKYAGASGSGTDRVDRAPVANANDGPDLNEDAKTGKKKRRSRHGKKPLAEGGVSRQEATGQQADGQPVGKQPSSKLLGSKLLSSNQAVNKRSTSGQQAGRSGAKSGASPGSAGGQRPRGAKTVDKKPQGARMQDRKTQGEKPRADKPEGLLSKIAKFFTRKK
jgi:ATP-dependent RNA helicase RhlB